VQDLAVQSQLTGWVRNLPDGRVEFMAEGPKGLLDDFVMAVNRGPRTGYVASFNIDWDKFQGEYDSFRIRF